MPGSKERLYQCGRGRGSGDSKARHRPLGTDWDIMQRRVKDCWTERRMVVSHQMLSAWCHKGNDGDMLASRC